MRGVRGEPSHHPRTKGTNNVPRKTRRRLLYVPLDVVSFSCGSVRWGQRHCSEDDIPWRTHGTPRDIATRTMFRGDLTENSQWFQVLWIDIQVGSWIRRTVTHITPPPVLMVLERLLHQKCRAKRSHALLNQCFDDKFGPI